MTDIDNAIKLVISDHRQAAAADMRERAAKFIENTIPKDKIIGEVLQATADMIRALPLEAPDD